MGWKASAIIVNTIVGDGDFEALLDKIGFSGLEKVADSSVDAALYPENKTVYIGFYKGNLIITAQDLPMYLIDPDGNEIARRMIQLFPETEICGISLDSTINHWAYAIIDQGKLIRARCGNMDSGTVLDFGNPVREELELLSRSTLNSKGEREYRLGRNEEVDREDQVGENFVFELVKRYTGKKLDEDDDFFEAGLYDGKTNTFRGIWRIEGKNNWGQWYMKKV